MERQKCPHPSETCPCILKRCSTEPRRWSPSATVDSEGNWCFTFQAPAYAQNTGNRVPAFVPPCTRIPPLTNRKRRDVIGSGGGDRGTSAVKSEYNERQANLNFCVLS
jgi:hypothetical protein